MRRVEDISNQIKTNYHFIDDTRDKVKYLTSLMDIRVNIPEEIEKQLDTDILITEYMESGDLEESFKIAAEECDCGWKTDITKRILK